MPLLHGVLHVEVFAARDLPAGDPPPPGCSCLLPCWSAACGPADADAYLSLGVGPASRLRTRVLNNQSNPTWNEKHRVLVADDAEYLTVAVKDLDWAANDTLGQVLIPVAELLGGKAWDRWADLATEADQPVVGMNGRRSAVHLSVRFEPASGALAGPVPHVYFPLRGGNRVTLYHDAMCTPGPVEGIALDGGGLYSESSCWDDMHAAISEAKRLIWITGWSVWTDTLLRRPPAAEEASPPLGDLLVRKANEGVRVLLLVWDDATNNAGLHAGLMGTHDEKTAKFFKDTEVECVLCPRLAGEDESLRKRIEAGNTFTHHQKTVVVDAPIPGAAPGAGPSRRVLAFVGGLDLTNGRYDDPGHPLFGTTGPGGPHAADVYQNCIEGFDASKPGPREPWHDIHARVEGPAALDVAANFMERWFKQGGLRNAHKLHFLDKADDLLLPQALRDFAAKRARLRGVGQIAARVAQRAHVTAERVQERVERVQGRAERAHAKVASRLHRCEGPGANGGAAAAAAAGSAHSRHSNSAPAAAAVLDPQQAYAEAALPGLGGEAWDVQLFRTINAYGVDGFPATAQAAYEAGLTVWKGKTVDASIHAAYVHLIRGAERFLYLENQYFLGSAHLWDTETGTPCHNLVPAEIALKICAKIKAGEPFCAYIVLPMFPEGIPTSGSCQAILRFQAKTREMMYRRIAAAIEEAGVDAKPTDYLAFFCLGQREPGAEGGGAPPPGGAPPTLQDKANASRRFMIYVHSKFMVVDDEYVVVGSANINQRSLDGNRDSEICIGAFQPAHALARPGGPLPRGQVAGFRRAVWKEHLGELPPEAEDPSTAACMAAVAARAAANWAAYLAPAPARLPHGHLLAYPTGLNESDWSVVPLPDCEEVPDIGGRLVGAKTLLPMLLTT